MEGTGSGQREMQSPPVSAPCRRPGCVFYAHHLFDGMCSKCFKDLKEQMQASSRTSSVNTATTSSNNNSSSDNAVQSVPSLGAVASPANSSSGANVASLPTLVGNDLCSTVGIPSAKSDLDPACSPDNTPSSPKEKTKKKRCDTCKKRVGLTGFDCRCGGHYCSVHRYSDMHSCGFNYHELAQTEIRKQNPVVAAEKVKKI